MRWSHVVGSAGPVSSGAENPSVSWLVRMGLCVCIGGGVLCGEVSPVSPSAAPWDLQLLALQPQPCSCLPTAPGCSAHCSSLRAGKNSPTATGEACASECLGTLCLPLGLGNVALSIFHLGLLGEHLPAAATAAVGFGNRSCHFPSLDAFNNWLQQWVFNSLASISRPAI